MTFVATGRFTVRLTVRFLVAASADGTASNPTTTAATTPACRRRARERTGELTRVVIPSTVCERTIQRHPLGVAGSGMRVRTSSVGRNPQPMTSGTSPDFFRPFETPVTVNV